MSPQPSNLNQLTLFAMYRVALILAALAAAGSLVISFMVTKPKIETLVGDNAELTTNLAAATTAKDESEKKAKEQKLLAEKSASKLITTEKKLEEASQLAEQQLARANKYFADLNKTTAEKNAAQEELARWSALRIQPNQVIALQQNLKKVGEEKAALVDQEKVLMRSVANLRNKLSKYEDDTQLVEMPGLRGLVLAIDPKWDFAIINVGSKQGAKEGGQVLVRRGDKLVGKLKIISVEEGRWVANILSAWKQGNASVNEGDAILY